MRTRSLPASAALALAALGPAPPAKSMSCSPGPYIVFFEPNEAYLDNDAFAVLEHARERIGSCGLASILIAAHTDTLESASLARKRMNTVRAYWIAHGMPRDDIFAFAFGAKKPRVPTARHVSERQNRRVEIVFGRPPLARPR